VTKMWMVAQMECLICGKEWIAVAPVEADYYECPLCAHMNPAPVVPMDGEAA
jgi:hypothetical protein